MSPALSPRLQTHAAVRFQSVSKIYAVYSSPAKRLAELAALGQAKLHTEFPAVTDVSFEIHRGETFCLIGENGSGKSTLLKMLAGVLEPSSGQVLVHGRVAALLELGAGFHPEFTGRENVYLSAAIHGYSRAAMDAKFSAIERFAEIGAFIDRPVKTYSSGMLVRLAFAVAIHVEPDILLVDEALAVGDFYFRQRCLRKVNELRARGVTIVFVSHSMGDIQAIGDRVAWMHHGVLRQLGKPDEVIAAYQTAMAAKDAARRPASPNGGQMGLLNVDHRSGDGGAEILGLGLYDETGDPLHWLNPRSRATVRIRFRAGRNLADPSVGFLMRNHLGVDFSGTSSAAEGAAVGPMRAGDVATANFTLDLPALYPAHFSFSPYVFDGAAKLDWVDNAITLAMAPSDGQVYGYVTVPCRIEVNREDQHA